MPRHHHPPPPVLATLWLLLAPLPAHAHDFWIEPELFRPATGEAFTVVLRVGEDFAGTSQPFVPAWFHDFSVTDATGRKPIAGLAGDDPAATLRFATPGLRIIGYHGRRQFAEIDAPTFEAYLRKEGLDAVRDARRERGATAQPGREYYSRCAKALVRVGEATGPGAPWARRLGYPLELVPLADPAAPAPDGRLPVLLSYRGAPLAGALVVAFTSREPQTRWQARTDRAGEVAVPIDRPGRWLVKAVHMVAAPPADPGADWESFWASLTFDVRQLPAGAGPR